jgi:hypothetical protein
LKLLLPLLESQVFFEVLDLCVCKRRRRQNAKCYFSKFNDLSLRKHLKVFVQIKVGGRLCFFNDRHNEELLPKKMD